MQKFADTAERIAGTTKKLEKVAFVADYFKSTPPEEAGIARFGKPEDIADLMAFLVSPAAKWMTGASVRMDGGEVKGI